MFLNNKKIRMKTLLLLLMLFIPLFCVGCGRSKVYENSGLMNDEQLSTLESLYGKGKADVLEVLNLEESSVLQGGNRGCWDLKDTVSLVGTDFSQTRTGFFEIL